MTELLTKQDIQAMVKEALSQVLQQKTVYLEDLKHPELELTRPIPVFLEYEGETVIANYYDTESYGCGDSEYEALDDLRLELAQTYLDLAQDAGRLGPLPQQWWNNLQTIIRRRT
jgi:hypothetical protein